jgi:hypothetical protein
MSWVFAKGNAMRTAPLNPLDLDLARSTDHLKPAIILSVMF